MEVLSSLRATGVKPHSGVIADPLLAAERLIAVAVNLGHENGVAKFNGDVIILGREALAVTTPCKSKVTVQLDSRCMVCNPY